MSVAPLPMASRCFRHVLKPRPLTPALQCTRLASNSYISRSQDHTGRRTQVPSSRIRWQSTDAAPVHPKISGIVDQISQLTLLETADLVQSLKGRLNIPDIAFGAPAGAAAAAAPAAAPAEEEETAPAAQEKTMFTLKLQSFDAAAKPKIIKEVKSMLGLSLVDSKKFVESAPKVLKEGVAKEEAEKIIATIKGLGGVVIME